MQEQSRHPKLQAWIVEPARDPAFRSSVWSRINRNRPVDFTAYLRRHALTSGGALALAVLGGVWLGHTQAETQARKDTDLLSKAYLASIDARYEALRQER